MNAILRRATPADAPALRACIRAAYSRWSHIDDLPDVAAGVAEDIAAHEVWVAEAAGALAGGLILDIGEDAHLMNVAVHPDHGGKGLGRALIAAAEDSARAAGCGVIRLATHVRMPDNIALYARLGWRETGREGVRVFMEKPL